MLGYVSQLEVALAPKKSLLQELGMKYFVIKQQTYLWRNKPYVVSTGLLHVREKSGKLKMFQGQGIGREF